MPYAVNNLRNKKRESDLFLLNGKDLMFRSSVVYFSLCKAFHESIFGALEQHSDGIQIQFHRLSAMYHLENSR